MKWRFPWTGRIRVRKPESRGFGGDALVRAAEDLAERSRMGEQNATSQIVVLGDQYRAGIGGEQVKKSYHVVLKYLQEHPEESAVAHSDDPFAIAMPRMPRPGESARASFSPTGGQLPEAAQGALRAVAAFGCDVAGVRATAALPGLGGIEGVSCAVVILAGGPMLSPEAYMRAQGAFDGEDARASFVRSADDPNSPPADAFGFAGFVFGRAARLQAIRQGGHFSLLSPGMAWELGQ